ncbi:MAG: CARDB domain-containing protein, partial [archaeon]
MGKNQFRLGLIVLFFVFVLPSVFSDGSLIFGGSFEEPDWNITYWATQNYNNANGSAILEKRSVVDGNFPFDGNWYFFGRATENAQGYGNTPFVSVTTAQYFKNKRIFVSLRNQKNSNCNVSGVNNCSTLIQTIDDLNNVISTPLYLSYSVKDWQNLDYNFEVGETPVRLRFKALADGWSSSTAINDIWVDNIRVTELDGSPVKGYMMIVSPLTNQSFKQRNSMLVVLKLLDANANQFEGPTQAEYKLKASDSWQQIQLTKNYQKEYYFFVDAPDEIGDHNLSVRVFMNGGWVDDQTTYQIYPLDLDLKINFIKAIQVIEDVDLVAGKATAVKVGVNNTNDSNEENWVKLTLTFNGIDKNQTKKFVGDYNFIFYVDNPYEEAGDYTISAEIDPNEVYKERDENNIKEQDVIVKDVKETHIVYVPVDFDESLSGSIVNFDDLKEKINQHHDFLLSVFPYSDEKTQKRIVENTYCTVKGFGSCIKDWNSNSLGLNESLILNLLLLQLNKFAITLKEHRVVGILPNNWHDFHGIYKGTAGQFGDLGYLNFINNSVVVEKDFNSVTAHELGHTYGLCDNYKANDPSCPNRTEEACILSDCFGDGTPTCNGNIVPNGLWVKNKKLINSADHNYCNLSGNYFSYMGSAVSYPGAGTVDILKRWSPKEDYAYLLSKLEIQGLLKFEGTQNVLVVNGLVDSEYNVFLEDGFMTEDSESSSFEGPCKVNVLDVNHSLINDYNFGLYFDTNTEERIGYSPFIVKIPFNSNISSIEIVCNGETKATKTVSNNSPTIYITAPQNGDVWTDTNSIIWDANDLDGDNLSYTIYYTSDTTTWNPLAMDLNETEFSFESGQVTGSSDYQFKIIASDGILSNEAVSGTFTILNPDITIAPSREWDLGTINNLSNISKDFNIVNSGNADLNVFDMNYSSNLNVTGLNLPIILQPGETQAFSVTLNVLDMNLGSFKEDINLGSNDPNQIIKRVKIFGEIEEAKPDLTVKKENISFNPVYVSENENITVSALVENLGDLNASNVNIRFYVDGNSAPVTQQLYDEHTVALYHADSNSGTT